MASFESRFSIGDKVIIDGDVRLVGVVTAVMFRNENPQVEVSWVSEVSRSAWIETWRLDHENIS